VQRRHGHRVRTAHVDRVLDRRDQQGVRADLDEHGRRPLGEDGAQGRGEAHRLAQVRHPVSGVEVPAGSQPVQCGGVHRHRAGPRPQIGEGGEHRLPERLDVRRVRGVVDLKRPAEHAPGPQRLDHGVDRARLAGEHAGVVAVGHGDADPVGELADRLDRLVLVEFDGDQGARRRQRADQRAAPADHGGPVARTQRAGDGRRGHLAHAVPEHQVRLDSPVPPEAGQADLDRPEGRLDLPFDGHRPVLVQPVDQRPVALGVDQPVALAHRVGEDRLGGEQLASHPSHWEPCPENTKTTGPGRPARPLATSAGLSGSRSA
jgi:hypothetical protein